MHEPNSVGYKQIIVTFGKGVVGEDGTIDRRKLGAIVFANSGTPPSVL